MSFSESIVIQAAPAEAFDYLADPSTAAAIDPAVISYEPDTNPMAVGTHNKIRFRMLGMRLTMYSQVREWEPGRRMVIESVRPAWPVRARATHTFEPHEQGTLYTWAMDITPAAPLGFLFSALISRFMQNNARGQQRRFKDATESR
jgi:carbon monoxide dehydrogenase subunit G